MIESKQILAVEDDSAIRRDIIDALHFAGYQTFHAGNDDNGLAQGPRGTFDLLMLRLILPGPNGFEILHAVGQARRAISRDELLLRVWRLNPKRMETRTINMHIANLREKLRDDSDEPKVLLTVRGKGYMFAQMDKR